MHIHPFKALLPKVSADAEEAQRFFNKVKAKFRSYLEAGYFHALDTPSLFVYDIIRADRRFRGLVGLLSLDHYANGQICPHEQTLVTKERQQLKLLAERKAVVKPVLLTFEEAPEFTEVLNTFQAGTPSVSVDFEDRLERHIVYAIDQVDAISVFQRTFDAEIKQLFVADGHHRLAASLQYASNLGRSAMIPVALFPVDSLEIHPFNRVVQLPKAISLEELQDRCRPILDWEILPAAADPQRPHEFSIYFNGGWHRLHWKQAVLEAVRADPLQQLDARLINKLLLSDRMGIEDIRTADRISYVDGPSGLKGLQLATDRRSPALGIALYPIEPAVFFAITQSDRVLPPKSTWFEPRVPNGLVVYSIDSQEAV